MSIFSKFNWSIWSIACIAAGIVLSGCSTLESIDNNARRRQDDTYKQLATMEQNRKTSAVVRHNSAKIADKEVMVTEEEKLPSIFSSRFDYMSIPQPFTEILDDIGLKIGIPFVVQDDLNSGGNTAALSLSAVSVDWNGTLKGLLDYLSNTTGMYWKYQDGRIVFYKTETRTFHVYLPNTQKKVKSSISLTGSGNAGGSGSIGSGSLSGSSGSSSVGTTSSSSSMDITSSVEIDIYESIRQTILAMLNSPSQVSANLGIPGSIPGSMPGSIPGVMPGGMPGGVPGNIPGSVPVGMPGGTPRSNNAVTVTPSLGLVTVTTNPVMMKRVEQYIKGINERFAKNIMIDVKVYDVIVEQNADINASIMLAFRNISGRYSVNFTGHSSAIDPARGPGTIILNYLVGRMAGSQLAAEALESVGRVSLRTSGQVIAANGQPTPLQVVNQTTYLASSSTTTIANAGTTTSLTPGTVTTGLTANFIPFLLGDNRILLQYQINLSSLTGQIKEFQSGNTKIQLPETSSKSIQQQAYLKDGQTIVLFGFEEDRDASSGGNGMIGVSRSASSGRKTTVIVMEVYSGQ